MNRQLYKNKYRISSARLQSWNYGNAGMYFITICTKNRICYFGNIDDGMPGNDIGMPRMASLYHYKYYNGQFQRCNYLKLEKLQNPEKWLDDKLNNGYH